MRRMSGNSQTASYEHLIRARPVLLWAVERSWSREEAALKGCELDAQENSAWLVRQGRARVEQDDRGWEAGPGEWMFPKQGRRRQSFESPFSFLSVTFRWQWPDGRHLYENGLPRVMSAAGWPDLEKSGLAAAEVASRVAPDVTYYLGLGRISLAQAAELHAAAGHWAAAYCKVMDGLGVVPFLRETRDPRILDLLEKIRQETARPNLDRAALSVATGWSLRQMDRLVKAESGYTVTEFHDSARYDHACRMLLESGCRIKEIAFSLGFSDLAGFSRWFARRSGHSPRDYRESFTSNR